MFDTVLSLDTVIAFAVLYVGYRTYVSGRHGPLPPGPKGWHIIGNALDIPIDHFWATYAEWGKQYGNIMYLNVLGKHMIILNSRKDVVEMFDKKHQIYTERPDLHMITEVAGWNQTTVLRPADNLWRDHRRNFSRLFGTRTLMQKFYGVQVHETRKFMRNMLRDPERLHEHIPHWAGAMILKIVYGYDAKQGHDPLVELVDKAMEQFIFLSRPGAYFVDFLPWLKYVPAWFPGAGFQRVGKHCRETLDDMINVPFKFVQEKMKEGTAAPSFVSHLLSADDHTPEKDFSIKTSAATIYAGGADTISAQVHGFYLLMLLWPDVQRKAQEEIDAVVGHDRLPEFNDRERLPYVEALVKECMRLHSAVPISGMRRALKDDVQGGYFIPKGTLIQPNVWQMLHDPEVYPDPMNLVPERWLSESPPPHPCEMIFGFGRRNDYGRFVVLACIRYGTRVVQHQGDQGRPTTFTHGAGGVLDGHTICHPKLFKFSMTPRSAKTEALILSIEHEL